MKLGTSNRHVIVAIAGKVPKVPKGQGQGHSEVKKLFSRDAISLYLMENVNETLHKYSLGLCVWALL